MSRRIICLFNALMRGDSLTTHHRHSPICSIYRVGSRPRLAHSSLHQPATPRCMQPSSQLQSIGIAPALASVTPVTPLAPSPLFRCIIKGYSGPSNPAPAPLLPATQQTRAKLGFFSAPHGHRRGNNVCMSRLERKPPLKTQEK